EIYNGVGGAVTALYEYHRIVSAEYPDLPLAYGGIPVEIPAGPPRSRSFEGKIRVMLPAHRGREAEKGADVLLDLFRRLDADLPGRMDLWRPGNVPYAEFCRLLDQADIVVDQLYSYTPATTALLAMARGAVAVTGGEDEFYRFIGEGERRPIFNPDPCDPEGTYSRLRELLDSPEALRRMSEDAPGFVRSHNSGDVVAARFERFWTR
ncbi:MAG: hypothetical protein K2F79_00825, partial [Muribaculaceae bacterium]|nr:hypothetical protein [Muribaculaceae bacterium]